MKNKIHKGLAERLFECCIYTFVILVCILTLYPFIYVFSVSISDITSVLKNQVFLLPKGINFSAYKTVFHYNGIWIAYGNTIFYTVIGTTLSLLLTAFAAYPLSQKDWKLRKIATGIIVFTMWFGGGMIPTFLVVKNLNLLNTRLIVILFGAISSFYTIIMRTYFESLPKELDESARIDGATDWTILFRIIIPLSKPVFAAIGLYYAVNRWNSFFWEMIFLSDNAKMPVQVFLMRIIIDSQLGQEVEKFITQGEKVIPATIKYATIIVTSLPIIAIYPFLQKYFVKGVMIGAVKS